MKSAHTLCLNVQTVKRNILLTQKTVSSFQKFKRTEEKRKKIYKKINLILK
ncbi:hypothetical protein EMPG_11927 [Blastomyces silverae]|uniref:Uncharacterized protein n=1 Tax=Blastomyces silverae TaxID=2060906 RepID=A0A0H1BPS5_9EURO|nr:hypothetical protein EMPG_11927 [Blastomyces silverae]